MVRCPKRFAWKWNSGLNAETLYPGRSDLEWNAIGTGQRIDKGPAHIADETEKIDAADIIAQWLRFYGPVTSDQIQVRLSLGSRFLQPILTALVESRVAIAGRLISDRSDETICCADNYETMLRMARSFRRAAIAPRRIEKLALALAQYQGLNRPGNNTETLADCLATFTGLPLRSITVETINDAHAARSPWLNLLHQRFDITVEMNTVTLYRKTDG